MDRHPIFFVTDWYIFEVVWGVFCTYNMYSFTFPIPVLVFCLLILVSISCIYCRCVSRPNLRNVLIYVEDCNRLAAPFLGLNYVVWSRPWWLEVQIKSFHVLVDDFCG